MLKRRSNAISRVVVVGGGFGGLRLAKSLARSPVSITLIDRSNHHLFQPLLYQVATAGLSPADIAYPIRSVLKDQKNAEVVMSEVTGVDAEKNEVITKDGRYPYDYLVLATGASHGYFGHPEWEKFAPGLKTIPDAVQIRQKILLAFEKAEKEPDPVKQAALLTFVLVGGGPTGVEMAGAIAELSHYALSTDFRHIDPRLTKVILVEAGPRILTSFPDKLSTKAQQALERLGVDVRTDSRVELVDGEGVMVNGKRISATNVIWAAGVVASPIGKWLGCETDRVGKVKVNPDLSVPNHPNIFVVGDAACVYDKGGRPLPGVAPVAMQAGAHVASVIEARIEGHEGQPFKYWDKGNLATVGRTFAIADVGILKVWGIGAWAVWVVVHVYYLIGFKNRILVLIQWAWAYLTFQRGARLITDAQLKQSGSEVPSGNEPIGESNRRRSGSDVGREKLVSP